MKHFLTFTQQKILKYYWRTQTSFTLGDLIEKKILHFPVLGRLTLRHMESKGQVLACGNYNGEPLYIGTTDSAEEWSELWNQEKYFSPAFFYQCFYAGVQNRYETQELFGELKKIIEEYKQRNDGDGPVVCDTMRKKVRKYLF
jgi:hypothetical protein